MTISGRLDGKGRIHVNIHPRSSGDEEEKIEEGFVEYQENTVDVGERAAASRHDNQEYNSFDDSNHHQDNQQGDDEVATPGDSNICSIVHRRSHTEGDDDIPLEEERVTTTTTSTNQDDDGPKYVSADAPYQHRLWEVLVTYWPLGLVAFGGPQAAVALLRTHLVVQKKWLDEDTFLELYAIGQGLPGPTATQLVISTATSRAGPLGGLLAFFMYQMPGLVVLTLCGILFNAFINPSNPPFWLAGLPPAAISLVFKAFYCFAVQLDRLGVVLSLISCMGIILISGDENIKPSSAQFVFPSLLAFSGIVTWIDSKRSKPFSSVYDKSPPRGWERNSDETMKRIGISMTVGAIIFSVWLAILILVILLISVTDLHSKNLDIMETMYRIGSIIYGGGQVVLPLLQNEVVPGWMNKDTFFQGLALTQSLPGPLFNFSAYLGAVYNGVGGALIAFLSLFGPGVILIFAVIPFWARIRRNRTFRCVLVGVNASAIGFVGAACVLLWEAAIVNGADAMIFCLCFTLDVVFNAPAPLIVLAGGIFGALLHADVLDLGQKPYCIQQGYQQAA